MLKKFLENNWQSSPNSNKLKNRQISVFKVETQVETKVETKVNVTKCF